MLDPQSCVGLAEAKAKSQEGVTANHYPFAQLVQQVGTGAFSQVKLPYGLKVSVRSAYHGYAARGAETDTVDKSLGLLHTTVALSRLFQGESGQVYCGAQNEVVPHPLSSLRDEQGRGTERRVNLQDPVVAAHWGAHGEWRLRPSDMEGESLGRMAELIGFTPDRFRERFDNVAGWGI